MEVERRGRHFQWKSSSTTVSHGRESRKTDWLATKGLFLTPKHFLDAFRDVKRNGGSAGVDRQSLKDFERDLSRNIYRLWNRVSSGCYFPPAVLEVGIPKDNGKIRYLGIPTVGDRIVQQVIKRILEPRMEDVFQECSYGYRPGKRAHDALEQVRQNSRACYYAIDLDIAAFFDNVSHDLLNLALDRHVSEPWIRTLINRWLSAPIRKEDGSLSWRQGRGTPQGGVISPLLANLFMHYTLDVWLIEEFPTACMVRYADDVVVHCNHWGQVQLIRKRIEERLHQVGLSANKDKTHVVFCKQSGRFGGTDHITLDFLGHRFQPRPIYSHAKRRMTTVFDCAISPKSEKKIRAKLRQLKFHLWHQGDLGDIAKRLNPLTRGWINYYGKYRPDRLRRIMSSLNDRLAKWLCRKYKRFGKSAKRAHRYLRNLAKRLPSLFYHWEQGYFHA